MYTSLNTGQSWTFNALVDPGGATDATSSTSVVCIPPPDCFSPPLATMASTLRPMASTGHAVSYKIIVTGHIAGEPLLILSGAQW